MKGIFSNSHKFTITVFLSIIKIFLQENHNTALLTKNFPSYPCFTVVFTYKKDTFPKLGRCVFALYQLLFVDYKLEFKSKLLSRFAAKYHSG